MSDPFAVLLCAAYFGQGFRALASFVVGSLLIPAVGAEEAAWLLWYSAAPWALKPLFGLVSDALPVRGEHRRPYIVASAAAGCVAWGILAFLGGGGTARPVTTFALLLLTNFSTAMCDVVVDALVAERVRASARGGRGSTCDEPPSDIELTLQTLCWGSLAAGGLAGSLLGDRYAAKDGQLVFMLAAAPHAALLLAACQLPRAGAGAGGRATPAGSSRIGSICRLVRAELSRAAAWKPLLLFLVLNCLAPSASHAAALAPPSTLVSSACMLLGAACYRLRLRSMGTAGVLACCQLALVAVTIGQLARLAPTATTEPIRAAFNSIRNAVLPLLSSSPRLAQLVRSAGDAELQALLGGAEAFVVSVVLHSFSVVTGRLCPAGGEATVFSLACMCYNFGHLVSAALGLALLPVTPSGLPSVAHTAGPAAAAAATHRFLLLRAALLALPLPLLRPLLTSPRPTSRAPPSRAAAPSPPPSRQPSPTPKPRKSPASASSGARARSRASPTQSRTSSARSPSRRPLPRGSVRW